MSITQVLFAALPWLTSFFAVTLPGTLKNDRLHPAVNGLLAGVAVVGFSFLTALAGGKLTSNLLTDTGILAGIFSAALAGPLKPLDSFLQSAIRIPLLHPPAQVTAIMQSVYPGGKPPQPIVLKSPTDQGG